MKELGELVRTHRENAGIYNQRDFSLAIGKAQSWVSRLESGALKETPAPEDIGGTFASVGIRSFVL